MSADDVSEHAVSLPPVALQSSRLMDVITPHDIALYRLSYRSDADSSMKGRHIHKSPVQRDRRFVEVWLSDQRCASPDLPRSPAPAK